MNQPNEFDRKDPTALAAVADGPRPPTAARVSTANRVDIGGGFTDIDFRREGGVLSFPIVIQERPIIVTATVCDQAPDALSVRVNQLLDGGLLTRIANSCVQQAGMRGSVTIEVESSVPPGSGAGASSQVTAGIVAALARCNRRVVSRAALAREAYRLETYWTSCGWQDQSPLVVGRCGFISAPPAPSPDTVTPTYQPLAVPEPVLHELEQRGLLVWTGRSHFSKEILDGVTARLERGEPRAERAWETLYSLARQARDTLSSAAPPDDQVSRLQSIVSANWAAELELTDDAVTTPELSALGPKLRGLGGYKLLGAGRGGFLLFIGESRSSTSAAAELLGDVADWAVVPWRIARRPARIESW